MDIKDLDLNLDMSNFNMGETVDIDLGFNSAALKRSPQIVTRRASSEKRLLELLGDETLQPGDSWHFISGGDIDSLSFLKHVINQQQLSYCLFSTWCMAMDDVVQFEEWIKAGRIKRLDAYVGEIFPNSYSQEWKALQFIVRETSGRVCVFRNHAKIFTGHGSKYDFTIESSANINTNPRSENTTLTIDTELYKFYKAFYDGIKSFDRGFDNWKPWNMNGK